MFILNSYWILCMKYEIHKTKHITFLMMICFLILYTQIHIMIQKSNRTSYCNMIFPLNQWFNINYHESQYVYQNLFTSRYIRCLYLVVFCFCFFIYLFIIIQFCWFAFLFLLWIQINWESRESVLIAQTMWIQ